MTVLRIPPRIRETLAGTGMKFKFQRVEDDMIDIMLEGKWVAKVLNNTNHAPAFVSSICQRITKKAREIRIEAQRAGQVANG